MSTAKQVTLFIGEEGELEFIYDDEVAGALAGAGPHRTRRASNVEPFHGGDKWGVDVSPILDSTRPVYVGFYPTRAEALAAEVEWVLAHLAGER